MLFAKEKPCNQQRESGGKKVNWLKDLLKAYSLHGLETEQKIKRNRSLICKRRKSTKLS
jgi:hypothetical protein